MNKMYKDPEVIYELYWGWEISQPEIGEVFGVSQGAIKYWMDVWGIPTRTRAESNRGKSRSEETKKKMSEAHFNPDSYNAEQYGSEVYWRKQREKALERDGYECQLCSTTNQEHKKNHTDNHGLHGHHIIPREEFDFIDDGERDWDEIKKCHRIENVVMLCASCHKGRVEADPQDFTEYHDTRKEEVPTAIDW